MSHVTRDTKYLNAFDQTQSGHLVAVIIIIIIIGGLIGILSNH